MRDGLAVGVLVLGWLAGAAGPAGAEEGAPPRLAAHRAVYDLSLARSGGSRGVEGASGRIAVEFSGDACEGYALKFRQVVSLASGETGTRTVDARSDTFESPAGDSFRFRSQSEAGTPADTLVDGTAARTGDGAVGVRLSEPAPARFALAQGTIFPTGHLVRLLRAARGGERTVTAPVYDGSGDGRKVYDTLAVIGGPIEPGAQPPVEAPLADSATAGLRRWPVRLSYFAPGEGDREPAYTMSFELYEDGVSRALSIDYGEFALNGDLTSFQALPASACGR